MISVEESPRLREAALSRRAGEAGRVPGRYAQRPLPLQSFEERFHFDRMVDQFPPVLVVADTEGRYHREEEGLAGLRDIPKDVPFSPQFLGVAAVDHELILREFHLAEVDALIATVDQEIDLMPGREPSTG